MRVVAISDVHVKVPHDEADKLLLSFLDHPKVQDADYIMLLGDIFDLMCGPHPEYISDFNHIFQKMGELLKKGKKIFFLEGNHDLHLESLFKKIWPEGGVVVSQEPVIINIEGKKYYFSHGDEHEVDNLPYQRYKKFILSSPLKFFANHLLPYSVLRNIGERASKMSRKKGHRSFNHELVKERFRTGVGISTGGKYDFVLGGHSHVKDLYQIPGTEETYINNGYALKSKTFIHINQHEISFVPLS